MGLFLKVLETPDQINSGVEIQATEGLLIGRARGNWIIEDERISTEHAEIQSNNQGHLFLVDKDSRNGIKVQGKRITKLMLYPGLILQLGDTLIEVTLKELDAVALTTIDDEREQLQSQIDKVRALIKNSEPNMTYRKPSFFTTPLKLVVIQGLQLNQKWIIEYGPFLFGAGSVGGLLVGKNMPSELFELESTGRGPMIRPLVKNEILKLNSIPLDSESLIEREDILSIHLENENTTRIRFTF